MQLQTSVRRISNDHGLRLEVAWDLCDKQRCEWEAWLGEITLGHDLMYAGLALVIALVCLCLHMKSIFLGVLGALPIALSFPLALYVYRYLLGITLFGVLHVIGIFVILGSASCRPTARRQCAPVGSTPPRPLPSTASACVHQQSS